MNGKSDKSVVTGRPEIPGLTSPSTVAVVQGDDKFAMLDEMLDSSGFFEVIEAARAASGKSKADFMISMKPNFMMTVRVENPPLVYTDPELVEHWLMRLRDVGYKDLRVVEAQNVYGLWYHNRTVADVAGVIGLSGDGYAIHDLTIEQEPFDYGGLLGEHAVGRSWRNADFRISFAKNKSHDVSACTLVIKNTYGCLPAQDKFKEYHQKREVDIVTCDALCHFPVHFSAIDGTWSLDGPLGYKEGFDVLRDPQGRAIREGNIHHTRTILGGRDLMAVEKVGMLKMGLDPFADRRFYKCAADKFGEEPFTVIGDDGIYKDWLNVGEAASLILDIGEEIPIFTHFVGESMSHVDESLFPSKRQGTLYKLMHFFGRRSFIKKVRGRKGERVVAGCEVLPDGRVVCSTVHDHSDHGHQRA